ncbi:MAG: apolipoprotein N-acyltransferase [Flavobacteriaceae bacterium]
MAGWVVLQWGWRRCAIAFAAGAVSALALAPLGAFPVLVVTLPVLVWLIDGALPEGGGRFAGIGSAAIAGWFFGFGYFLAGLWWIGSAFLVEAETFAWMLPFAIAGLPAFLALYVAIGAGLARAVWCRGPWRVAIFAAALSLAEIARGIFFTGFPWNGFGDGPAANAALLQTVSLTGIDGFSFLTLFIFAAPAALGGEGRRRWAPPVLAATLLVAMAGFGLYRLQIPVEERAAPFTVRIVQPDIDQRDKWKPELKGDVLSTYLSLSDQATGPEHASAADVDLIVWPESSLPLLLDREPSARAAIAAMLPLGTGLAAGMQRVAENADAPDGIDVFNSIQLLDDDAGLLANYDKVHLVPFGEYLPFQRALEKLGLRQLTRVIGGFSAGGSRALLKSGRMPPALPLICYEIIFSQAVAAGARGADWILNVTNDAWFGRTSGPYQHLLQARLRAVETGLPVVRAANTGISAVFDPYGRMLQHIDLGGRGVIDAALPAALAPPPFLRAASWWRFGLPALLALTLLGAAIARRR